VGSDSVVIPRTFNNWRYFTFQTTCPADGLTARLRYFMSGFDDDTNMYADALFMRRII